MQVIVFWEVTIIPIPPKISQVKVPTLAGFRARRQRHRSGTECRAIRTIKFFTTYFSLARPKKTPANQALFPHQHKFLSRNQGEELSIVASINPLP